MNKIFILLVFFVGCLSQPERLPEDSHCADSPFGFHTARAFPTSLGEKITPEIDGINFYEDAEYIGVAWERPGLYCHWIIIQPTKKDIENGIFHWRANDDTYKQIPENMCILGNIGLPERVRDNSWELTESESDYITFVKAVVERYDGDGINDMPGLSNPVLYWQVENEPDFHGDWQGYFRIQEITYKAVKEACPQCEVLMGGMSGGGIPLIEAFYRPVLTELKGEYIDIFDYHWYGNARGDYRGSKPVYEAIRKALDENGFTETDIWITETGTYSGSPQRWEEQTEEDQARDVVKRYVYPLSYGVKKVFWAWGLMEGFKHNNGFFDHTGFIYDGEYPDDLGKGNKKLSYYTFKKMTETLEGCDWDCIETLEESDLCIFRVMKNKNVNANKNENGSPVYIVWRDYFHLSTPYVPERIVTLNVGSNNKFTVTEAIPHVERGIDIQDYETAFSVHTYQPDQGILTFPVGKNPVFVEVDTSSLSSSWLIPVVCVGLAILSLKTKIRFSHE